MHRRSLGLVLAALVLLLVPASAALAAPVTVNLRVEGTAGTLFEGPVRTDGRSLQTPSSGTAHPCNVGENVAPPTTVRAATPTTALADSGLSWDAEWFASTFGNDFLISRIGPDAATQTQFWGVAVNARLLEVGGCQEALNQGDDVLWAFDAFGKTLLRITGPTTASVGTPVTVAVRNATTGGPVVGATVGGATTNAAGNAAVTFSSPGVQRLKAEAPGAIRSNALVVTVGTAAVAGVTTAAPDRTRPLARLISPRNGRRYRRSGFVPRAIRGSVTETGTGILSVKLRLTRRLGNRCWYYSGPRERFIGRGCRKGFFFRIGDSASFDYLLPEKLPRGRYVLDVLAVDKANNRDSNRRRGRNRVVFEVR